MYVCNHAQLDYQWFPTNANQSPLLLLHWFRCQIDVTSTIFSLCMEIDDNNLHMSHLLEIWKPFSININLLALRNNGYQQKRDLEPQDYWQRGHCCYIITKPFLQWRAIWLGGLPSLWWLLHVVLDSWALVPQISMATGQETHGESQSTFNTNTSIIWVQLFWTRQLLRINWIFIVACT
jgi:hypothetical protein